MLAVAETENLPVREAREGDPKAWAVLFRRYQKPLYVYVYELLRDEQTGAGHCAGNLRGRHAAPRHFARGPQVW
jgi:RNA polymerase sigma-70 factor (ECF subfamily)